MKRSALPSWKLEFPDMPTLGILIPSDYDDASWKNDVCPHFLKEFGIGSERWQVQLWVDYEKPSDRELSGKRYRIYAAKALSYDALKGALNDQGPQGEAPDHYEWSEGESLLTTDDAGAALGYLYAIEIAQELACMALADDENNSVRVSNGKGPFHARELLRLNSFGDLHDYLDANTLGGCCEEGGFWAQFVAPEVSFSHDPLEWAQTKVGAWLADGSLNRFYNQLKGDKHGE